VGRPGARVDGPNRDGHGAHAGHAARCESAGAIIDREVLHAKESGLTTRDVSGNRRDFCPAGLWRSRSGGRRRGACVRANMDRRWGAQRASWTVCGCTAGTARGSHQWRRGRGGDVLQKFGRSKRAGRHKGRSLPGRVERHMTLAPERPARRGRSRGERRACGARRVDKREGRRAWCAEG
jgi:hypothetical protein